VRTAYTTDQSAIREMFKALRKRGLFARMNFQCCQSCGWAAAHNAIKPKHRGVVFYHGQDAEALEGGELCGDLYLAFGGREDDVEDGYRSLEVGAIVMAEANKRGIAVKWDGTENTRIALVPQEERAA
jgi:hypothetical protein